MAALTSGHTRHRHHSRNRRKAKDVPATRLRESRLLSILPAIRGQGEKVYTTVLFPPAGKRQQQALMAADASSTTPGRLFITVRVSNLRFLVDTGSDLCVFPRRIVPGSRERTSYDLIAANVTPIPTYGWHTLTLNLGLRRDFTWRFVVADVQIPIIGVDLIADFSLLVDCRNNRIMDGVTSLSAPAQTASTPFLSVINIASRTSTEDLFTEFREHTSPSGVQRTVRHSTVHHIKTTPGPPVSC